MSAFDARSATGVNIPWSLIWLSEEWFWPTVFRLNALHSFPTSIDWNRWKAGRIAEQTDCDSVHTRIGCEDPNPTSIDWNCRKSRIAKQTDCDSVHTRIGCEDPNPTSIDWNCRKSRIAEQAGCSVHTRIGCEQFSQLE